MADGSGTAVNVFLSLGSNIAPEKHLRMACRELTNDYGDLMLSSVYENAPVGFSGNNFLNMVVGFATAEEPERIVNRIERLHRKAGRVRYSDPFSSRTLDLDLLLYGDVVRRRPMLPREDIEKYGFVLEPLAEVAPELRHPVSGVTMQAIWGDFDQQEHPMTKVDIGVN
ncbi:MAG: 2-amino-4-hydroxy-6-hydroxymethyldihydropteridine diphosphokinase [Chromatiales bacterium]|jgi:2-amino-4-hydroxy-6-hydroxymethyldihydropteridine diphosphokinase|nr:2-amino-4-hydroxy-6-hydroxymethyldihydropteridine diphosphokinase [Chromatiales bacterium]MDP6150249.1 2-amino-4-hydroxy-6-hydroxymethyldihydropteridine diphosphokinase [Gammaproteobacteria bacterium]MDP7093142.1 2-amino-4-hydroxy-6-hydroxymethyldihydropteridine diphosphokinase [Gammaproteobacteria bacterium]MDP7271837.1 2-amino-4-hydroxy-6-hydroxymethyldihydropteridine diphosphokinase [Gammaproteobacteria bacterium]HJP05376.1 2-amino-4-hydroxy-6-hydroxymethyldihydropteridine diphosphokinase